MAEEQQLSQPQEAPPLATEPTAPLPEAPTVETQAAPPLPEAPAPPAESLEERLAKLEQENLRLRGAQSAADKRRAQVQAQLDQAAYELQRQQASVLQQRQAIEAQAVEGMDDEQRKLYEAQRAARAYYDETQRLRQEVTVQQWRSHLDTQYNQYVAQQVPKTVLDEAVKPYQHSPNPQDVLNAMHLAATNHWRQQAMAKQQQPAQQTPQAQVPQAPRVTSHTQQAQVGSLEEDLQGLAAETAKTGKSTVFKALKRAELERQRSKR